jgi:hypothetical protein
MVTLRLKPTTPSKRPMHTTTAREFWEAAGVQADKMRLLLPDFYDFPPSTTGAVMPAREAVVLLQNLPPGYAVSVEGQEGQLDVICATGLVRD